MKKWMKCGIAVILGFAMLFVAVFFIDTMKDKARNVSTPGQESYVAALNDGDLREINAAIRSIESELAAEAESRAAAESSAEPSDGSSENPPTESEPVSESEPSTGEETSSTPTEADSTASEPTSGNDALRLLKLPLSELQAFITDELNANSITALSSDELAEIRARFDRTVFFGDSMAQAFIEYELIDATKVVYKRGGTIDTITEKTSSVAGKLPEKVVIFTGLNDCNHYMERMDAYEADYRKMLDEIIPIVGASNVYVLSLTPPSNAFGATRADLAQAPVFDQRLREICQSTGVNYIDLYWMVRQSRYRGDGIHFDKLFYQELLRYLYVYIP